MKKTIKLFIFLLPFITILLGYSQKIKTKNNISNNQKNASSFSVLNINKWHNWVKNDGRTNNLEAGAHGGKYIDGQVDMI